MSVTISYQQIAIRLTLAFLTGLLIGINRDERGHAAGMRTTILVCLAACVAMLQANLLMNTTGKAPDSFVVLDLMRLPLGILSGIGFIGAGAILRKDNMVLGVTTAATLWFVTVLGLCIGGGQLLLGLVGLALAIVVLWGLKVMEKQMHRDRSASLVISLDESLIAEDSVRGSLVAAGCRILTWGFLSQPPSEIKTVKCDVAWRAHPDEPGPPTGIEELTRMKGLLKVEWMGSRRL
jgi:putative Mg2+ transporter-C (MgtC) family protein